MDEENTTCATTDKLTKAFTLLTETIREDRESRRKDAKRSRLGGYMAIVGTLVAATMTGLITISLYKESKVNNFHLYMAKRAETTIDKQVNIRNKINDAIINTRLYSDLIKNFSNSISKKQLIDLQIKERNSQFELAKQELNSIGLYPAKVRYKILKYLHSVGGSEKAESSTLADKEQQKSQVKINAEMMKAVCANQIIYRSILKKVNNKGLSKQYNCDPISLQNINAQLPDS